MSDKESGSNFIAGFIVGAIAGLAIGFLYAPKSGKETRAYLKERASGIKEKASIATGRAKEAAREVGRVVKEKLSTKEA
jgi:gas vesicle protein